MVAGVDLLQAVHEQSYSGGTKLAILSLVSLLDGVHVAVLLDILIQYAGDGISAFLLGDDFVLVS